MATLCEVALENPMSVFVDEAQLNVRGGDGGAGCVSFRREGPVAFGGPNGGDGGKGGDVWLVADRNVASLLAFRDHPHRRAANGVHGKGKDLHGRRGEDLIVPVPEGTIARDMYTGEILADLVHHGDRWLAASGGRGGRGNHKFMSNKRRAPTFAEQGEEGFERWLKLELKLMADVPDKYPTVSRSNRSETTVELIIEPAVHWRLVADDHAEVMQTMLERNDVAVWLPTPKSTPDTVNDA